MYALFLERDLRLERRRERLLPGLIPGFFLHPPDFFTPWGQRPLERLRLDIRRDCLRERLLPGLRPGFFLHPPDFFTP